MSCGCAEPGFGRVLLFLSEVVALAMNGDDNVDVEGGASGGEEGAWGPGFKVGGVFNMDDSRLIL